MLHNYQHKKSSEKKKLTNADITTFVSLIK